MANVIKHTKLPKANIRKEEGEAVSNLEKDKNIIVLEADKGNVTVVMDVAGYKEKAMEVIGKEPFKVLTKDPTKKNEKRVNDDLKRLAKNGSINKETLGYLRLTEGSSRVPLLYGRVKLHKDGYPRRPIVSSVGSCTYKVAKQVARVLAPYSKE